MIVCKYGILMTLLWFNKKNRIVTYQIPILSHKKMSVKNMINLCSLNVNGLQNREKRGRAIEWVKSMKCDIAYFQETHFDQNIARRVFETWNRVEH